jgi:gamma-glutamyltranspeptidase/glutathione hydrolase
MMWRRIRNCPGGLITLLLSNLSSASVITTAGKDKLGAVSSESKICSEIGIGLLERGVDPAFDSGLEV